MKAESQLVEDSLPPFFARLGLDQAADERAIRRAYARLLKQTDQETDSDGFQSLRQAYEVALLWLAQQRQQAEGATNVEPPSPDTADSGTAATSSTSGATENKPPSVSDSAQPGSPASGSASRPVETEARATRASAANDSEQAARGVLQELRDKLSTGWPKDRVAARAWLDATLEGDRLVDMDARFLFEWGVAGTLADGWGPGKENLFGPAIDCFGWREDRGRLTAFNRAGGIVAAAIAELEFFDSLPDNARAAQRDLIRRLRENKRPGTSFLLGQMPLLDHISQLYPHWLHLITDTHNIERWREWAAQIPKWRGWMSRPPRRKAAQPRAEKSGPRFGWVFVALLVLSGLGRLFGSSTSLPPAQTPASYSPVGSARPLSQPTQRFGSADSSVDELLKGASSPGSPTPIPRADPKPLPLNSGLPATARPAVAAAYLVPPRATYPNIAKRMGQEGQVVVMAIVDPDGKVRRAQVQTSSGHAVLDEAATTAVLNATFLAARDAAGKPIASTYKIPINFKLTDGQGITARAPRSYGEAVRDTVLPYIIFGDPVSGNPAAEVTLKLMQDGRIQDHKLTKSSGNKAWDAAVLRAIQRVPRLPADQNGKVPPEMVIAFRPKA
ncbi:TonB family protein [Variovorax sp. RT4R15]|uniref:TonB family protein n=1 Tax=Variovorax sp. RT4R15 TaxID=3443737 RepID=UPI003F4786A6